jgi:hypothetical protein
VNNKNLYKQKYYKYKLKYLQIKVSLNGGKSRDARAPDSRIYCGKTRLGNDQNIIGCSLTPGCGWVPNLREGPQREDRDGWCLPKFCHEYCKNIVACNLSPYCRSEGLKCKDSF